VMWRLFSVQDLGDGIWAAIHRTEPPMSHGWALAPFFAGKVAFAMEGE
jgi:hypothetical protein